FNNIHSLKAIIMRRNLLIICIIGSVLAISGCKKSNSIGAKKTKLTHLHYSVTGSPSSTKDYEITYNSAGKISRIDQIGSTTLNTYYYLYYYSTHLDSVIKFRTSDTLFIEKAIVQWTGNKISFSWENNYGYDGSGRLATKFYPGGGSYRVSYVTDSVKFYWTPDFGIEHLEESYTFLQNFKNPYLIADNENEAQSLNFSLNSLYSDFYLTSPYVLNYGRTYNSNGSLAVEFYFTPEGNTDGYPDKITITAVGFPTTVIEFDYEQL
ncbi:MAG: hypothetical protein JWN78_761, partial [Bacteroidota bacterium]|nr:hypothetical protein [Bacteroidota bacterium]